MAPGLRERKKAETRTTIAAVARQLVDERGLDAVTVDEIAAGADVSPRTFFNYFSSKEEAIVGIVPEAIAEVCDRLRDRPIGEPLVDSLRTLFLPEADPAVLQRWLLRNDLVRRFPELSARHLEAFDRLITALSEVVAERNGTDLSTSPESRVLVTVVVSAFRSTIAWWQNSDRSTELQPHLERTFALLQPLDTKGHA